MVEWVNRRLTAYTPEEWGIDCDLNQHCVVWVVSPLLWNAHADCRWYRMSCCFCTLHAQWWNHFPALFRTNRLLCPRFGRNEQPPGNCRHCQTSSSCVSAPTISCNEFCSPDSQTQTTSNRWHSICHFHSDRWLHGNAENQNGGN